MSKSQAKFHIFSNSSSSIEQDVDLNSNDNNNSSNTNSADGYEVKAGVTDQQAQPHDQQQQQQQPQSHEQKQGKDVAATLATQSTNSSTPTLRQPQPQSPQSQQQQHHQLHAHHSQHLLSGSPTRDDKFHNLVKKTINKLKLSPAVPNAPTVASASASASTSTSPSASQKQQQQSPQSPQSQSQSQSQHHVSTPFARSRYNSVVSCNSSSSDIFERSVSNGSLLCKFTNPDTPFHHNIENYTSPILDTTAEILVNPNIQLEQVKLNCYCDDDGTSLPSLDSFKGKDVLFSSSYNNNHSNNSYIDGNASTSNDCNSKPTNQSTSSLTSAPPFIPGSNTTSPTLRPRARSIISQSIISTLDNSKHNNNNNNNSSSNNTTAGGISHLSKVKSSTTTTGLTRPHLSALRSSSFAGTTCLLRNKPSTTHHDSNTGPQGKSAILINRKSSPKLASLVTRSSSGIQLAASPTLSTHSATSPTLANSAIKAKPIAESEAKYTHSPTTKRGATTAAKHHRPTDPSQPPVIDFYSFADMCTHEDEELAPSVAEIGEERHKADAHRGGGGVSSNDDTDDDEDDGVDPLDDANIQEFGFNGISSGGSGSGFLSGSIRDGSISTSGTMFTREVPARRGSYATISAKDYIGVL
ncbi:hypothetical protein KGF57_001943 [Candida theae]|uniref:Uncharacterized protein n=1 Tax=Candida theae TaxID=1198502 RepID=A0AAD5BGM6_9ASCO|nr:uncharacterized protein KGF57_001943 [Candida theae]KAI5960472.1 hypothetical protein KGF57_001943 [Candida theae]